MTTRRDRRGLTGWCGLLPAALLLAGCTSTGGQSPGQAEGPTMDRIREAVADGARSNESSEPPPEVQQALMPEVAPSLPDGADEVRFDLSVRGAPARPFFMGLVEGTPYNMVVHPDVSGTVTLELKDVTVPQVMDIAQRVYGYEYERQDNGYIVLPARMQSRIYQVDYLNVNRSGESNTRVNSGQVAGTDNGDDDSRDGSSSERRSRTPGSRIKTRSEADFWGRLRATVQSVVGSGDGRSVIVDPNAGLVVVRAMPGEHRDVAAYLEQAQTSLQRQVILEAKIIEVTLSEAHQTGINWAALAEGSNGDAAAIGGAELVNGTNTALADPNFGLIDPNSIAGQTPDFGGLFAVGALTTDFAALIRLLDTQGDVQVLSSPRVSTVNNQKAVIKVGSDEFFVTDVDSDQNVGTATTTETVDIELTPFFSGIALDVTPQIGRNGDVTLHVHPTVSEVVDQEKTLTVANRTQTLPLALSTIRESDSIVRARDGQVIVIGGLMQDENRKQRAKSGGLGDIPLIGALFRQKADSSRQSELVILLRPIVADSASVWRDELDGVSRRLNTDGEAQQ